MKNLFWGIFFTIHPYTFSLAANAELAVGQSWARTPVHAGHCKHSEPHVFHSSDTGPTNSRHGRRVNTANTCDFTLLLFKNGEEVCVGEMQFRHSVHKGREYTVYTLPKPWVSLEKYLM